MKYLLCLVTRGDDIPVGLFAAEYDVLAFINSNPPPDTVNDPPAESPLRIAIDKYPGTPMRDILGYGVTRFYKDGTVDRHHRLFWLDRPFTASSPLFPEDIPSYCTSPQEEWDSTGCGPVG